MQYPFGTGRYDNSIMVGLGIPGPYDEYQMRLVHEETRTRDFDDRILRLERRMVIQEQRTAVFGAGGW